MTRNGVLDWLLEEDQPAVRYLALTQLLEKPEGDPGVKEARGMIAKRGWASDILREQLPGGSRVSHESLYRPKYTATNWMLLVLADLGLTRSEPRIGRACELWIQRFSKPDSGFGTERMEGSELCLVGNTARALVEFGYVDDPRVRGAFDWLVREQKEDGGWHCWGRRGVLDAWEGLSAFAAYPRQKWTRGMKEAVERGAEFFLERRLYRQGTRYGPWFRFHYPTHYYYDLLVGLEVLTALGYGGDARLDYALNVLREKRRPDGRWALDAVHPDVEGSSVGWYKKDPPTPFGLERVGEPSKMITLRALSVGQEGGNGRRTGGDVGITGEPLAGPASTRGPSAPGGPPDATILARIEGYLGHRPASGRRQAWMPVSLERCRHSRTEKQLHRQ